MEMTEDAQRRLATTLDGIFAGRLVDPARRENIRNELSRLLTAEAERKAAEWGQSVVTTHHLEAALAAYGGAEALAAQHLRHAEPERAGFWIRALAYVIDAILLGVATTILFLPFQVFLFAAGAPEGFRGGPFTPFAPFTPFEHGPSPAAFAFASLMTLVTAVIDVGYFTFMEARHGRTLGKMALRLRVLKEDGAPPDMTAALVRSLAKVHGLLVLVDGVIMAVFFGKEKQRASDKLARTIVVREP